ncbi:uncharacterized protein G2W53_040055 [Senna tora]|uniref:Uncharacterized protein n=1 Tax=Senna tora TaxID=362788 RepID=A0A834SPT4_9FABA|nr:uncharacterized protein G2W53_040055 [Senna tora]
MHVVDRQGLAATMSDCLETSCEACEASFCHRLHFDPAYAREILSRKKVYPCVIDFCTAPTVGRSTSSTVKDLAATSTGVFTLSKLNDRVTCGTRAPLTRNLGSARATAETYREGHLAPNL